VVAPLTLAEEAWTGGGEEEVLVGSGLPVVKSVELTFVSDAPRGLPALRTAVVLEGAVVEVVSLDVADPNPTKSTFVGLGPDKVVVLLIIKTLPPVPDILTPDPDVLSAVTVLPIDALDVASLRR